MTNQNEAQTIQRIEELKGDLALNFKQICELLALVKSHYLHRDQAFRWFKEVATGKLVPEIVIAMQARPGCLKHMIGRPRDVQLNIARGVEMSWCYAAKGVIVERRTDWKKMTDRDFKRMFPSGRAVRALHEQRAVLEAELTSVPPTHVRQQPLARVDVDAQTFKLGVQTVPLNVVLSALREAGIQSLG
jgi:hypothetical protein